MTRPTATSWREPLLLLSVGAVLVALTAIHPKDLATWGMETFPIAIVVPLLLATGRGFRLTPLLYRLIFVHALILAVGGHYTYAEVPLGFWIQEAFGFARNHYDRIGHLAQGFVPALVWRELLLRRTPLRRGGWLVFVVTAIALAGSAGYEFIEWWAAVLGGSAADAFLGTQGDPWDTQWDMFLALVGSLLAQLTCARLQDSQLRRMGVLPGTAGNQPAPAVVSGR